MKPPQPKKLYSLDKPKLVELHKELLKLLDSGYITLLALPYGHPIFFCLKKEGLRAIYLYGLPYLKC